jgi:hypothetical protein
VLAEAGVKIHSRNHRGEQHGDDSQPAAESVDGERH